MYVVGQSHLHGDGVMVVEEGRAEVRLEELLVVQEVETQGHRLVLSEVSTTSESLCLC